MKFKKWALLIIGIGLAVNGHSQSFLTNGLVAYYPFNGNANDASGYGNNGVTQNVSFVSDRYGRVQSALSCSQPNSCVIVGDSSTLEINSNITISAWINVASNQAGGPVVIKGLLTQYWNYGLSVFPSGANLSFGYDKSSGSAGPSTPSLTNGLWQQIVVTISEPSNAMKFYVNGQLLGSPVVTYSGTFDPSNFSDVIDNSEFGYLYIGNNAADSSGGGFDGAIDDVRIYNVALSSNQVAQLYANESAPIIDIRKAVYLTSSNLWVGSNYQVQVSTSVNGTYTNYGASFTATNAIWHSSIYWDIDNWGQLFFRLETP